MITGIECGVKAIIKKNVLSISLFQGILNEIWIFSYWVPWEKEKNVILYEDDLILISQATGTPVRGYLMIVTKQHIHHLDMNYQTK